MRATARQGWPSLVHDVRELAAQQPMKAPAAFADVTSVLENPGFSASTLSRTGTTTLSSPSQLPLLDDESTRNSHGSPGSYEPLYRAFMVPQGCQEPLEGMGQCPSKLGVTVAFKPRRLDRLYVRPLKSTDVPTALAAGARLSTSPSRGGSRALSIGPNSAHSRRLAPVNLRVASPTGRRNSGGLPKTAILDGCAGLSSVSAFGDEAESSVSVTAHDLATDIATPSQQPAASQSAVAPSVNCAPGVEQPSFDPPSEYDSLRCQPAACPDLCASSHATPPGAQPCSDARAQASSQAPPLAGAAAPAATPTSAPEPKRRCRITMKLHSGHVQHLVPGVMASFARLLLPYNWALQGLAVRPGCIELVMDYTYFDAAATPDGAATHNDGLAGMNFEAGGSSSLQPSWPASEFMAHLHQQGLLDPDLEPTVAVQIEQRMHMARWLPGGQPTAALGVGCSQGADTASCGRPCGPEGGPGPLQVQHPVAPGTWTFSEVMAVGPVLLLTTVSPSCVLAPPPEHAGGDSAILLYVAVQCAGLRGCTVRCLGRFLPVREVCRVAAKDAYAMAYGMDAAGDSSRTAASGSTCDTASGTERLSPGAISSGAGGGGNSDGGGDRTSAPGAPPLVDWDKVAAAALEAGEEGEVIVVNVSDPPKLSALLQVELRAPWDADVHVSANTGSAETRTSDPTAPSKAGGQHEQQLGYNFPVPAPLTTPAPVLLLCSAKHAPAGCQEVPGTDRHVSCLAGTQQRPYVAASGCCCGREHSAAAVNVARELEDLRARMAASQGSASAAIAAANEFLCDLGALVDATSCSRAYSTDTCGAVTAGSAERAGPSGGEHPSFSTELQVLLGEQLGLASGVSGSGGQRQDGGDFGGVSQQVRQHLADTATTLLAACASLSMPHTARLVMITASQQLRLCPAEALVFAAADGDPELAASLSLLLGSDRPAAGSQDDLPPAHPHLAPPAGAPSVRSSPVETCAPSGSSSTTEEGLVGSISAPSSVRQLLAARSPNASAVNVAFAAGSMDSGTTGRVMAMAGIFHTVGTVAVATPIRGSSSGSSGWDVSVAGSSAGPLLRSVRCQSGHQERLVRHSRPSDSALPGMLPATLHAAHGSSGSNEVPLVAPRYHPFAGVYSSAPCRQEIGRTIDRTGTVRLAAGVQQHVTGWRTDGVAKGAGEVPIRPLLPATVPPGGDSVHEVNGPAGCARPCCQPVAVSTGAYQWLHRGGPSREGAADVAQALRGGVSDSAQACNESAMVPEGSLARRLLTAVAISGAVRLTSAGAWLTKFGEQVAACFLGYDSPALEQAFWKETAAQMQSVYLLYACMTLVFVSLSVVRALVEDGWHAALFMTLYQGGQAALLAAFGLWGSGRPEPLFGAVIASTALRCACHALISRGLAPLPSFVLPVCRAGGDLFNEGAAKAVFEQLPGWLFLKLLIFLELPAALALYQFLDGHGQGLLTNNVALRLACLAVLKSVVAIGTQAFRRLSFQARAVHRVKVE